jgi:glycosyltransferase involved in cell wall biosynthesis
VDYLGELIMQMKGQSFKSILVYPSDKHGCGFYRNFFPLRYLSATKQEYQITEYYAYNFDLNYVRHANWVRFQRQVTDAQLKLMKAYKKQIQKFNLRTRMTYDLDDLVHGILPSNILAYRFYTKKRQQNLIEIFKMVDRVSFSTQFLKNYYEEHFGINHSIVVPNYLPKYMWGHCGKRNKYNKSKKMRILWAGSASHIGRGGDLEFLMPLIKKTKNEFEWVFFGVQPPELEGQVEFHKWADIYKYPSALDAVDADVAIAPIKDDIFNYAKSDLKILEYSALGLPTIGSTIGSGAGPYDMVDGLTLCENRIDDWYQALKGMQNDPNLRMQALEAGQTELEKRWMEDNIDRYVKLFA